MARQQAARKRGDWAAGKIGAKPRQFLAVSRPQAYSTKPQARRELGV